MHELIRQTCHFASMGGIDGRMDIFAGESTQRLEQIGREYRDEGLAIYSFHLPYRHSDDLSNFSEWTRRNAVEAAQHWMENAAALGVKVAVAHPAINRAPVEVDGIDNFLRALERSLKVLLPLAESLEMTLALENMTPGPEGGRFGSQPEHFLRMREVLDHPHLGFCLDTGHALLSCHERAPEMLEAMAPRLAAFHLVDNAGDRDSHLAPGHGLVEWDRVFQGMLRIDYSGVACIEAPPFAYGPDYAPEAFRQMIETIERLAEDALGRAAQV